MNYLRMLLILSVCWASSVFAENITQCDRLASNPNDPRKIADGVDWDKLDSSKSIPICIKSLENQPDSGRLLYLLGRLYAKSEDYSLSRKYYSLACEKGYAMGCSGLAIMYRDGYGVEKDGGKAIQWFKDAYDKGYPRAYYEIGVIYRDGMGVDKDSGKAKYWFDKAIDRDVPIAIAALGNLYETGSGVKETKRRR